MIEEDAKPYVHIDKTRVGLRGKEPSVLISLGVVALLALILIVGTVVMEMPIEMVMFFAMVILMMLMIATGFSYQEVQDSAFDSIRKVVELLFILLAVGMLISSWAMSGTIPTIIKIGLETIHPSWFFVTAIILCSVTSLVTGTSWGTMGSVGVALMAVGDGLGIYAPLTAGAVISGAYFGDKLSVLSDSTNLSAAITGTPLMTHVRYMLYTTGPAYILTLVTFGILGFVVPQNGSAGSAIGNIVNALDGGYKLGWITLLPIVITVGMLLFKLPPFVSIMGGAVAGAILAVAYQGMDIGDVTAGLYDGYVSDTGDAAIDALVSGGGMMSMAGLLLLFMFAVGVSGLMYLGGYVHSLLRVVLKWANTRRRIMVLTSPTMIGAIGLGASYSFGAVMVGTIFAPAFKKLGLKSENLSRTLEDSGTVYDPFFPWSGGGVFAAGVLGVATLEYMPFLFFAYFSTLVALVVALTQFKVAVFEPESDVLKQETADV
ncbi:Na+/H+ antiporter NhaC [Arthrobacter sp. MYb227]|uniref:Na+/H+ antiporter NhaC family protein n=1 Tax=Arthrobacter sp. MYb227 TaxID=1848601 RepID=UPI000CFBA552|nr:Na+/H+ antiporter NhaC family protein [Arthrobacter sp. MYb227]PQZ94852.1 Na+/H+ antiporter NhaC [Arthrobacter sp. MYb227]